MWPLCSLDHRRNLVQTFDFLFERTHSSIQEDETLTKTCDNFFLQDLSSIRVNIHHVECGLKDSYFEQEKRPRSPGLLHAPIISLTQVKDRLKLPPYDRSADIYVSGYEAERQMREVEQFGSEAAFKLAKRRETYAKHLTERDRHECQFIAVRDQIFN